MNIRKGHVQPDAKLLRVPASHRDTFAYEQALEERAVWEGPPFRTFKQLVRHQATRWPRNMLAPAIQRAADRDPELEIAPQQGRHRRVLVASPAPSPADLGNVEEGRGP